MTIGLWLPGLMFWSITLSATLTTRTGAVGDFVDTTKCYDGLAQADANGDNRVERDEYLTFVKFIGPPGFLADIDSILDAPLTLQVYFSTIACICGQNGGDAQCCLGDNAHIPIDGVHSPDPSAFSFLFLVCSLTSTSINLVLEEAPSSISTSPTISPTTPLAPSPMPTATQERTQSPSSWPSAIPTTSPRPTTSLSSSPPSSSPSAIPTTSLRRTTSPSSSPPSSSSSAIPTTSLRPTTSPSSSPTSVPSAVPSTRPSSMPTGEGIGVVARTIYTVVVVNSITETVSESSYVPDLIASMNVVAVEVASEVDFGGTRSNGSSRRRLEVRVSLPTFIDRVVDAGGFTDTPEFVDGVFELGACPSDLANPDNDKCEQVTASVGLFLDDEAPQVARQLYQTALDRAIAQGRLQDALTEINPDSPVRILTEKLLVTNVVNSSRYRAGIVIGAVAVLGVMVAILIVRKRKRKPAFDELQPVSSIPFGREFEPDSAGAEELDSAEKQRTDEEAGTVESEEAETVESEEAILGATKAYYGQSSSDDDIQSYIGARSRASSTASAGQSDWRSICMSSINSDSASANELDASTFSTKMPDPDTGRTELDDAILAIVAGDRTAVGATAALLAANESSFSSLQSSIETGDSTSLRVRRVDEQKAAELYQLIEGGDWEGIIHAASKLSKHDKSLDVSVESHQQDSQRSASNAVLVDEPKTAGLRRQVEELLQLHGLIERGGRMEGVIRAASTIESDGKSLDGSLSHPGPRGSSSVAELSHPSIASSSVKGSISGSTTGSGITPHTFQSSPLSTETFKNRDRAELSRQVEELFQLYTLIEGRVTEGAIRAASTFSRDDKSLDGSILSHLGSPGSASGAVLVDEPQAAELHRLIQVGDWEGVRRAATAFSSDSKSLDGSILSHQDSQGSASNADLVDEPKASELHRLIQVRDWEGVRRAASTFSSDDKSLDGSLLSHLGSPRSASGAESSHRSIASSSIDGSASGSTTGPGGTTPHTLQSFSLSTVTSKNRDRSGLRRNVEELIHRMAPEEMEHVDETMLQFKGREDELLETLRSMQERLTQATTNKQVKLETKQAVREKRQLAETALSRQEEKKNRVTPPTIYSAADEEGERSANFSPASFDVALPLNNSGASSTSALKGGGSQNDASHESNDEALRQHQFKEKKTALPQAEMLMGIAEQNKMEETEEGGGATSQAADSVVIARSLSKMKEKEQKDRSVLGELSDQNQADKDGQESV